MPELVMQEISREELKALKRQAAIRAKEEEYNQKRKAQEEREAAEAKRIREEAEAKERRKVEDRLNFLRRQAAARAEKKLRNERLNQKRQEHIDKKHEAWLRKANAEIQDVIATHQAEEERLAQALEDARARKRDKEDAAREAQSRRHAKHEELEQYRGENEENRKAQRDQRAIYRVSQLKTEAAEELESFILNPAPVPLKQVLAGRLRPVPTVTELLAAYKDQKEELKDLQDQDIPTRALLRNQSLFQYVKEIQDKAEAERIKPPEPQQADLGRTRKRGK